MKRLLALVVTSVTLAGCGGSPSKPSDTAPRVTSISPTSGPTSGGTTVTIGGTNFSAGAVVTIGGTPASSVTVMSTTTLTAVTGQHSAGLVEVVVAVGGRAGSLPGAFTYIAGQAPAVQSITAQGVRKNEPERFADIDEEIAVTANVQDPDTPVANLRFTWTAPAGTFSGTGPSVKWRAPVASAFPTPGTVTLSVSVTDGDSTAAGTVIVRVHNSAKEVGDIARQFLVDFSEQTLAPELVVRNFSDSCRGKSDEIFDVRNNQLNFDITQWSVGQPSVSVNFGSFCPFRDRFGDACAQLAVDWTSTCIVERGLNGDKECDLGHRYRSTGIDQVSAIYTGDRWWLCDSDFNGVSTELLTGLVVKGLRFKK